VRLNPSVREDASVTHDQAAAPPAPHDSTSPAGFVGDPEVQAHWDKRYSEQDQMWSGKPNGTLLAEVAGLTPGRALDVGCGEGADAIWLAGLGWDVTALEVSGVALERATRHAAEAGVAVHWVHAGMVEAALPPASFDLVSAQYPVLPRTPDAVAEKALLDAVAPGGVLLFVHHADMEHRHDHGHDHGHHHDDGDEHGEDSGDGHGSDAGDEKPFDPADYVWPTNLAAVLGDDWVVEVDERRPRIAPESGAGAGHTDDLVLRARRLR
jgi:SAM-dependent methyltransferase